MQDQRLVGALTGIVCVLLVMLPIAALISAVILRAACSLFNKIAGSENAVPEPGFGKALGITVATWAVNLIVSLLIGLAFGMGAGAAGVNAANQNLLINLITLPAGFLVMSGMLTSMLPTSFGKAALVTLLTYVVAFAIAMVVALIVVGVGFGLMGLNR